MNRFFHKVIEPSLKCIPVLTVTHSEYHNSRECRLAQTIHRNVYTEFDRKLSLYLAASRGDGFPAYTVTVEVAGTQSDDKANLLASTFHHSVPHALTDLAERAYSRTGPIELTIGRKASAGKESPLVSHKRKIDDGDIEVFRAALGICRDLGDAEFLEISGDFSAIVATPPSRLNPVVMHLQNGTVSVPSSPIGENAPLKWPIYAFAEHASTNLTAQSYLVNVSHALVAMKEEAILAFHAAAERQVQDFHRALDGNPLQGHWLKVAEELVARLRTGLGNSLNGISANSRGIALDLSATVSEFEDADMLGTEVKSTGSGALRLKKSI